MFRKICFFITVSIGLSTWQTGKSEQYKAGVLDRPFESKPAQTPSDASPSEALLAATVRIETRAAADRSCGSGTIVGYHRGKAIVATCAHIFSDDPMSDQIKVDQFADDAVHDTLEGQLVAYDVEDDVAIVAVAGMRIVTAIPVASAKSKTRVGAPVLTGGCDGGARPTVEATVISDIGRYCGPANLCVASCPSHGRSGGGLMSRDQQLIGICSGIDTTVGDGVYAGLRCVREQFDKAVVQLSARGDAFIPSAAIDQRPPVSAGPTSSRSTTDVVCYIRGRNNDDSRSVVLRNVTAEFLNSIESEIRRQRNRENPAPLPRQNDPSYAR